jgi:hypothetical protein
LHEVEVGHGDGGVGAHDPDGFELAFGERFEELHRRITRLSGEVFRRDTRMGRYLHPVLWLQDRPVT